MRHVQEDPEREERIAMEAIVDAYGPEEQALGWWCYLDMKMSFPFKARCAGKRSVSPLKVGEEVEVLRMAPEEDCMHDMFVIIRFMDRTLGVPLSQLEPLEVDEHTGEAIADWHYWVGRGHMF